MKIDDLLSLASSKDVALLFSLLCNFCLAWGLRRVYQAKEKLHNQLTEMLKVLVPYTLGIKKNGKG